MISKKISLIFLFLLFINNSLVNCFAPPKYDYSQYNTKYFNESLTNGQISQDADDASIFTFIKYVEKFGNQDDFSIKDVLIMKTGKSTKMENTLSYCINSAVLVSGHFLDFRRSQATTNDEGAFALCATNEGDLSVINSTVSTMGKNSVAVYLTDSSSFSGKNSYFSTTGENSPALSSNGFKSISLTNCSLYTSKKGSPLIQTNGGLYLTQTFGWARNSHAMIIDASTFVEIQKNSILNCTWEDIGDTVDASVVLIKNTSDHQIGDSDFIYFHLDNSTIETNSQIAPIIIIDRAKVNINMNNANIKSKIFLKVKNAEQQIDLFMRNSNVEGEIIADEKSKINIQLMSSNFTGAINPDGKAGFINYYMDKRSSLTLTGNSNFDEYYNDDQTQANVFKNSFTMGGVEDSSNHLYFSQLMLILLVYLLI